MTTAVGSGAGPPECVFVAALAGLPGMGSVRVRAVLAGQPPSRAWSLLCRGVHPADPTARWREGCRSVDPSEVWLRHRRAGIEIVTEDDPRYPDRLRHDDQAPAVLFSRGDVGVLDRLATVAVVGTRSATRYGVGLAAQLGAELSGSGVTVVSGLAVGIDGAAHEGACAAALSESDGAGPPLAVVAGGLDEPYPRRHARLWERLAGCGLIVSECPVGVGNERWRFPVRNRLLAALSRVVVVVECHPRGGSLHTVAAADRRGIPVGAVPGSVRSPASAGTNALLADGAFPVRDTADVLVALSLAGVQLHPRRPPAGLGAEAAARAASAPQARRESSHRGADDGRTKRRATPGEGGVCQEAAGDPVLLAVEHEPSDLEAVVQRAGLAPGEVAARLEQLAAEGLVEDLGAGWWARR